MLSPSSAMSMAAPAAFTRSMFAAWWPIQALPSPPRVGIAVEDAGLGPREQEILDFLVAGLSYKEIATELNIKVSTVGTYVQRIYEKLHVRSRREIIARYRGGHRTEPEA
jgi:DNA-binding NarL/FixJ family response regulator